MRIDLCVVIGTMCNLISESVDNVEREREREREKANLRTIADK